MTGRAVRDVALVHERFQAQVERTPDATAIVFEGTRLTYRQLNARANRLAHHLRQLAVAADDLVAINMERSIDTVVGILGVLKAGAAYLPLDPAYPSDRLTFMLEDSGSRVMVTHSAAPVLHGLPDAITVVDLEATADHPDDNLNVRIEAHHLAYVIYTSGSTGKPKGVLVTHDNVARLFDTTDAWFRFGSDDVWTFFHSHAFDFSVWEIWGALMFGARLIVVSYGVSRSPEAFYELLSRESVTVLNQTPSAFQQLARVVLAAPETRPLVLRYVIFGGEALELNGLRPWFERFGDQRPRLVNMYGITETTVHVTYRPIAAADVGERRGSVIGVPLPDLRVHLLDGSLQPVPDGATGEICVEGAGLARGYLNRPELTAERFVQVSLGGGGPVRLYRSGDSARRAPDGDLEYLGRIDQQVKIRGFRIELGEIESAIAEDPGVREVVVVPREDTVGDKRLVAYVAAGRPADRLVERLRVRLAQRLPSYMVPATFVLVATMPLTENGKIDRKALPAPDTQRPALGTEYVEPQGSTEETIASVWRRLLHLDRVGANDSFFDLGGSSLLAVDSLRTLRTELGRTVPVVALFRQPTVRGLAAELDNNAPSTLSQIDVRARALHQRTGSLDAIAIVGMAGRFPGASTVDDLWTMLCAGQEGVRLFGPDELDPRVDGTVAGYVRARGVLDDADKFDAGFFGDSPASADLTDPQQRVLLETAWMAIEDAGVVPGKHGATIGVYAGTGHNTYLLRNVVHRVDRIEALGELALLLGNDKDFVATRIAYKLNLQGPALSVHTACSTSLVAVCLARRGLLDHECDIALAGAASITVPQNAGHVYADGAMLSADGHTRTFDAAATGTVFSDGAGVVVLKRLSDAERDGDRIYAVIRGAALNNDGAAKASYSAPSVEGQAKVIALAHAVADVDPATISYVEAHGTATPLGDPIEVAALTQAFRIRTDATGFCAIGSIKTNLGHLTAASGVAGLMKTALALRHAQLPPSLFFERPNPNIDFSSTPFFVQKELGPWPASPPITGGKSAEISPRRAGVSSFGVGGTNAHVILEEAPPAAAVGPSRTIQLLTLSAKTEAALDRATLALASHLEGHPELDLADVAYTLQCRRTHFACRRFVVAESLKEAAAALRAPAELLDRRRLETSGAQPAFVFPGQGTQYPGMGRALYECEPSFKAAFDRCAEIVRPHLDRDLREVCFDESADARATTAVLGQTMFTQPALFAIEYSIGSMWQSWGITPRALVGHSVGEFVAACLADVFSLEDAASLVAARGRMMQGLPAGSMLSVRLPAEGVMTRLSGDLALAASNGPELCVVSGPSDQIEALEAQLTEGGIACRRLKTSHAFHSPMMNPVVEPFAELVARTRRSPPRIPIVSTATGNLLTAEEATSPYYWAQHLRAPVRFLEAMRTLTSDRAGPLLEVGPRTTSATLARQIIRSVEPGWQPVIAASLQDQPATELASILRALGQLWLAGTGIKWDAYQAFGRRQVVSLPAYSFARDRHWLDPEVPNLRLGRSNVALVPSFSVEPAEPLPGPGVDAVANSDLVPSELEGTILAQLDVMNGQLRLLLE